MPKIMVSLAPRGAPSFIINLIDRPSHSTLSLDPEALEGRFSKGGFRWVEFLNFRHFRHF
jgi:hypothetical protein